MISGPNVHVLCDNASCCKGISTVSVQGPIKDTSIDRGLAIGKHLGRTEGLGVIIPCLVSACTRLQSFRIALADAAAEHDP